MELKFSRHSANPKPNLPVTVENNLAERFLHKWTQQCGVKLLGPMIMHATQDCSKCVQAIAGELAQIQNGLTALSALPAFSQTILMLTSLTLGMKIWACGDYNGVVVEGHLQVQAAQPVAIRRPQPTSWIGASEE